jgi:hypothetical protein
LVFAVSVVWERVGDRSALANGRTSTHRARAPPLPILLS